MGRLDLVFRSHTWPLYDPMCLATRRGRMILPMFTDDDPATPPNDPPSQDEQPTPEIILTILEHLEDHFGPPETPPA